MGKMFQVSELVQVAVDDEKSGVAFYSTLAQKGKDPALKNTFADLAEQERYHQQRFEKMLADLGDYKAPERYADEYLTYLHTLTSQRAFPDERAAQRMAEQCPDDTSAVELSLRFERDTLILMNEMRRMVREKDRPIVDELIAEEQSHLVVLGEARRKLAG
jgi:rubrerythrin